VEVGVEEVDAFVLVVDPLLRKNFQLMQSRHSESGTQGGTVSYSSITEVITLLILWLPIPTRQPRSPTVS
jgi:hypothetical protein